MEATLLQHLNSTGPAQILIASIWQGLFLTACVWTVLKLAAAFGLSLRASTRFALWMVVFLLVGLLPGFALLGSAFNAHAFAAHTAPAASNSLHLQIYWAYAFEALWMASSLFSLMRLLANALQTRSLFVRSTPVSFSDLDGDMQALLTRQGNSPVQIRISNGIDTPSVIGFCRPAVLMPRSLWHELGAQDLRQILMHELAHLRRGDDWTNLVQKLLRACSPLNPALFWAERHLCRERERACDDAVLDADGNARAYATCLTRLAENRLVRRAASLAPGLWKRPSELANRVENILHRRPALHPLFSRGLLAASLAATLGTAFFLQRCPRLVAFTGNATPASQAIASAPDLATGKVMPARYDRHRAPGITPALYHDAVYHPQSSSLTAEHVATTTKKRSRGLTATHPRLASAPTSTKIRFVQMSQAPDTGEVFTLIMFTVEVPRNHRISNVDLPIAAVPSLSLSDDWIAFQI